MEHSLASNKSSFHSQNTDKSSDKSRESKKSFKAQGNFVYSSSSTNAGDHEEPDFPTDSQASTSELNETQLHFPSYQLRNREVPKFLASIPNFFVAKPQIKQEESDAVLQSTNNQETTESCSQQSISMLQDAYEPASEGFPELMETCINSKLDIITISSDEESNSEQEENIERHTNFIAEMIKLKEMVALKEDVPVEKLSSLLKRAVVPPLQKMIEDDDETCLVPSETLGYFLKSAGAENALHGTVQALLACLQDEIEKNLVKIACCWHNSVYEMSVEVLNKLVDSEPRVREMVSSFLCRLTESILRNEKNKNLVQESKSMLVTIFCNSIHLSYAVINFITNNLKCLKKVKRKTEVATLEDKLEWTRLTKNSCYLLRILETLLNSFKTKLEGEDIEEVLSENAGLKNYNVLEMWKKNWRQPEVREEEKPQHEYKSVVGKWCEELDDVLVHCVKHVPVSSLIVARCATLAKDIMKLCHPEVFRATED